MLDVGLENWNLESKFYLKLARKTYVGTVEVVGAGLVVFGALQKKNAMKFHGD